jgi:hypothetical protein
MVKPFCEKCYHRRTCKIPCEPIRQLLLDVSASTLVERYRHGSVELKNFRERHFHQEDGTKGRRNPYSRNEDFEDCPENRLGFDVDPSPKATYVFLHRVVLGKQFKQIGEELGIQPATAQDYFTRARDKLVRVLDGMKTRGKGAAWASRSKLSTEQKAFILHQVFELPHKEIKTILPEVASDTNRFFAKVGHMRRKFLKKFEVVMATE